MTISPLVTANDAIMNTAAQEIYTIRSIIVCARLLCSIPSVINALENDTAV